MTLRLAKNLLVGVVDLDKVQNTETSLWIALFSFVGCFEAVQWNLKAVCLPCSIHGEVAFPLAFWCVVFFFLCPHKVKSSGKCFALGKWSQSDGRSEFLDSLLYE